MTAPVRARPCLRAYTHSQAASPPPKLASLARALTWQQVSDNLSDSARAVFAALRRHGPATTRELAEKSGIDILNVRPRVCDLCAADLVVTIDIRERQGVYRALEDAEIAALLARRVERHRSRIEQPELAL